jgi:hypothetical protein
LPIRFEADTGWPGISSMRLSSAGGEIVIA